MKNISRKLTLILVLALVPVLVIAAPAHEVAESEFTSITQPVMAEVIVDTHIVSQYGSIFEVLTSAIDDSPFVAAFAPETGRVSFLTPDGELTGYRYVYDIEAFWEMVAINAEVTSQTFEQRMAVDSFDRVNRDVSYIDVGSRMLIEYDEYGNRTETYLDESFADMFPESRVFSGDWMYEFSGDAFYEPGVDFDFAVPDSHAEFDYHTQDITPFFDTSVIRVNVPRLSSPIQGVLAGGWQRTTSNHSHVGLWTFGFPAGMHGMNVFFTNQIGDDTSVIIDVRAWSEVVHPLRFRGESYGARVSSFHGAFNNIQLRFFAIQHQNTLPTINVPAHDSMHFDRGFLTITWAAVPGATYRISMRNLTNNLVVFRDRSAGTATSFSINPRYFYEGHVYRVAVSATVGGRTTWSERRFEIRLGPARQDLVNRASSMNSYAWFTPQGQPLTGWRGYNFRDFHWHNGIPYTQSINQTSCRRGVVPWWNNNAGRMYFEERIAGFPARFFAASFAAGNILQPMYGNDCSGYISAALNLSFRHTTHSLHDDNRFPRVGHTSDNPLQRLARLSPGDFINASNNHVVMVYTITPITNAQGVTTNLRFRTLEQTPPRSTWHVQYANDLIRDNYIGRIACRNISQDHSWPWVN